MSLEQFNTRIATKEKSVLVYFSAQWCTVCARVKPSIEELSADYGQKLEILKVDADKDKEVAEEFEINVLPVLIMYKNGVRQWVHVGYIDKRSLKDKVNGFL